MAAGHAKMEMQTPLGLMDQFKNDVGCNKCKACSGLMITVTER